MDGQEPAKPKKRKLTAEELLNRGRRRMKCWRKVGFWLAVFYLLAAARAAYIGLGVMANWWSWGKIWSTPNGQDVVRAVIAALFAVLPPLYFAIEYWQIDSALDPESKGYENEKAKAIIDSVKMYQESVAKLWIGVAAAIAFLYVGDFPKKDTPSPTYLCQASGSTYRCAPQPTPSKK